MMSEIQKPSAPEQQLNPDGPLQPTNSPEATRFNDSGMVNFSGLGGSILNLINNGADRAGEAYQQHIVNKAQRQLERAGTRLEKMDHKDGLYDRLSTLASGGDEPDPFSTQANEARPMPRNGVERFLDKRLESRAHKKGYREAERRRVVKTYGGEASNTLGAGTKLTSQIRRSRAENEYRQGGLTAQELRQARFDIATSPARFSNPEQRRTRRRLEVSSRELERARNQPVLTRWRDLRRKRAIGKIQESWETLEG